MTTEETRRTLRRERGTRHVRTNMILIKDLRLAAKPLEMPLSPRDGAVMASTKSGS
jgi:hypothetical protein